MQAWFARKSFELRKTWKKQGMKYYTTLLGAAGAAVDKTREKPDITPKLDMMSMRNDAPRTGRTIQVAKKKPLTYGETLIIINVQTSRTIKNKKQNR
mgnify:FL=1